MDAVRSTIFIDLRFSKYCLLVLEPQHSKYWNIYWVLIALRLTKSGIEYFILTGSSFFPSSSAKSRLLSVMVVALARTARDFSRILGLLAPEIEFFRWPAGACAQSSVPAQ